jgi:hypothetical protein
MSSFALAKFLQMLTLNMQMYHWTTTQYSRHVAAGTLVTNLQTKSDTFVEVLQGMGATIVQPQETDQKLLFLNNVDDVTVIEYLKMARTVFTGAIEQFLSNNPNLEHVDSLTNIRDEIIADIEQTLYLFNFK